MEYNEYKQLLIDELWRIKPQEVQEYKIDSLVKQNQAQSDFVSPVYVDGGNMAPVFYLSNYYSYEYGLDDIKFAAQQITEDVINAHGMDRKFDMTTINAESAKEHLSLRLYNRAMNPDVEKNCAHINYLDLMAVPRWNVQEGQNLQGSFLVDRNIQQTLLNMTDDEMMTIAINNSMKQQFTIRGIYSVMRQMMKEVPEEVVSEMMPTDASNEILYVMTNSDSNYGAISLLSSKTLKHVPDVIHEKYYYVIPSSVHEVLIVPASKVDNPADLREMCQSINETQVAESDRLGDNIYRYDGNRLQICNTMEEAIAQNTKIEMDSSRISRGQQL